MVKKTKILFYELGMILGNSDFEYPIFVIYLLHQRISNTDISLLFSLQAFTVFIFEYITGVLADRIGSKQILIFGSVSMVFAEIIFICGNSLIAYAVAICFISCGVAAKSGADMASLYELVNQENTLVSFEKIISGFMAMKSIWPILTVIIGAHSYVLYDKLPFFLSIIMNVITIITFVLVLPKGVPVKKKTQAIIRSALKNTFSSKRMLLLLVLVCTVNPVYQAISNFLQANLGNTKITISGIGYIYILISIGEALGSKIVYVLMRKIRTNSIMKYSMIIMCVCTYLLTVHMWIIVAVFLGVIYGIISTTNVIEINKIADNSNRATMMSQQHAIVKISQTLFFIICGLAISKSNVNGMLYAGCFLLLISIAIYFKFGKDKIY